MAAEKNRGCGNVLLGAIAILLLISMCRPEKEKPAGKQSASTATTPRHTPTPGQAALLEKCQREGHMLIESQLNRAYVAPWVWKGLDAKGKEDLCAGLAIHCGNEKGTHLFWVDVYDKQSGRKLAKFSESWGFTVY